MTAGRHRVVIVGGGFGGAAAAKGLRNAPVDITLVDRANHHLFQPLLYQVATGILSEGEVAPALRGMFRHQPNVRVLLAEVTDLDLDSRRVEANVPDGDRLTLPYDTLVVAAGATHAYFGHDEWADHAPGMKTIIDARRLRTRILGAFEMAEASEDEAEREEWLTFVIVGAGPTGVELTGQVAALAERTLRGEYRRVDPTAAKIILIDAGAAVLASFPEKLRNAAERDLREIGADVHLHTAATAIDEHGIEVDGPQGKARIPSRTVIWAAGVQASPLAKVLGQA
ncbi:MAG: FAD-dependent oxidoreductase, partial [Actinomycetota bacterium]|nr:FAD-dependent oxidoreductase [Actinomycetota bacterium]